MPSNARPQNIPIAPRPGGADDLRWDHTAKRERLLNGTWRPDLEEAVRRHVGSVRKEGWGGLDESSNLFKALDVQLSVLYDRAPLVRNTDPRANLLTGEGGILERSGIWSMARQNQRMTIGLNESIVMVSATEEGSLRYRLVSPGKVVAESDPETPDRPTLLRELRLRQAEGAVKPEWVWDVWDPRGESFRIEDKDGADVTGRYLDGSFSGDDYLWRSSSGRPFIPGVLYHRSRSERLFNAYDGSEVVDGSINAAVGWSFWFHIPKDASWAQRYAAGVRPIGLGAADVENSASRSEVVTDPSTILMFEQTGDAGQPLIGQWGPASDPNEFAEALSKYEARIASFWGVSPGDVQRVGGQARSGYAIAISNAGKREAQRRMEPQFRAGDLELIRKSAMMLNRIAGLDLPESGYEIEYQAIPKSPQETEADRRHVLELLEANLIDRVKALMMLNPGMSRASAEQELQRIAGVNAMTMPR